MVSLSAHPDPTGVRLKRPRSFRETRSTRLASASAAGRGRTAGSGFLRVEDRLPRWSGLVTPQV